MAKASHRNRITVQLDPRIALEAIMLNRLESIPKVRHQEWLRGLLVQGFQSECQVIRTVSAITKPERGMQFSDWMTADSTKQAVLPRPNQAHKPPALIEAESMRPATKPFAQLSKVMG